MQLRSFSEKLLKENIPAANYIKEFTEWDTALKSVLDLPYGEEKKLLIIDEFPYIRKCSETEICRSAIKEWDVGRAERLSAGKTKWKCKRLK